MKKIALISIVLACAGLVSCSPSKYSVAVELSGPTKSGLTLNGKTISVAYLNSGVSEDSLFLAYTADGFIETLESEYFDGDEAVPLFKVDLDPAVEAYSKDGMLDLIMETGTDLVFLFDLIPSDNAEVSSQLRLYAYDSMNKSDTVQLFTGKVSHGKWAADLYGKVVGQKSADIFAPSWTREYIYFYYFSSESWNEAVAAASEYRFKDAVDIWITLVNSKDLYKAACARYNVAAVCYIYGQHTLALKWLDRCDDVYTIPESATLRKKINAKL